MNERQLQQDCGWAACRMANHFRAELCAAGLNRGEVSCIEFILMNRTETLIRAHGINIDDWVEWENERLQREATEGFLDPPLPITVLEVASGFRSLKKKGMVEDPQGGLQIPVIETMSGASITKRPFSRDTKDLALGEMGSGSRNRERRLVPKNLTDRPRPRSRRKNR